jgi:hypothetical protein
MRIGKKPTPYAGHVGTIQQLVQHPAAGCWLPSADRITNSMLRFTDMDTPEASRVGELPYFVYFVLYLIITVLP